MNLYSATPTVNPATRDKTLKSMVKELVTELIPATVNNNSFIINDIPGELRLVANPDIISSVMRNLLNTMAAHTAGSCIRITAKTYSDVVLIQVKDHSVNGNTLAYNLQATQPIAERIGGFLGITSQWKNETVIVFSFPNLPLAA